MSREVPMSTETFDPPLDKETERAVRILRKWGIETIASCSGGEGHPYSEPTIRFDGDRSEGFKALAIALQHALPVHALKRTWTIEDGEPTGPCWELIFWDENRTPLREERLMISQRAYYGEHILRKGSEMQAEALQVEFHWYIEHQDELVRQYDGKWIVIVGHEVIGAYDSDMEAYSETTKTHELGTFLIQLCGPGVENYTQTVPSRVSF